MPQKQKEAVKSFSKAADKTSWTVNGSASKGKAMVREISKLLMMAYNGECDEIMRKVKRDEPSSARSKRIEKSAAAINRNGKTLGISIPAAYVLLKQEEVQLAFEFAQEKEEEKEALREAREQEREARKLEREIAAKRTTREGALQYLKAYKDVSARLKDAGDDERADLRGEGRGAQGEARRRGQGRSMSITERRTRRQASYT